MTDELEKMIEEARKLGGHKTKKAAVNEAKAAP